MKNVFTYLKGDRVIWMIAIFLGLLSLVSVYSFTSILTSQHREASTEGFLFKHAITLITGFVLMYYAHNLKYTSFSKLAKMLIWVSVILLFVTLVAGATINSAGRWLVIPIINQKFQTSDLAKIVLIIYVARMLAINQDKISDFKTGVLPILIPVGLVCALILPENFSTAAMLFGLCLIMMFFGRVPFKYIIAIVGGAIGIFLLLILMAKINPELLPRLETWTNRLMNYTSADPAEEWQINNAHGAIYNGGWFGQGPGNGDQKTILPQAYADFLFAAFIEEFGSIGGIGVLMLYLIFLFRTIKIASKSEKLFGTFMVVGLGLNLVFQAFVNMAVCTKLFPVTGQNMPLLSMGGTSTWFTCISIGIILSVSRSVQNEVKVEKNTPDSYRDEKIKEKEGEEYAVA